MRCLKKINKDLTITCQKRVDNDCKRKLHCARDDAAVLQLLQKNDFEFS